MIRSGTVGRAPFALAAFALAACSSFERRLEYGTLASEAMLREMDYAVYTPPGWTPQEHLPLVVFLHGGGDGVDCFDRWGIGQLLDEAIANGQAPRVVVCVPEGEFGFWEDWYDGSRRYREWVVEDLVPYVRRRYGTPVGREHLHVMGISMEGHGTLRLALLEGHRFASAAAISAPIMDADQLVAFTRQFWVRLFVPAARIWGPTDDVERVRRDDLFARWQSPRDLHGLRLMLVHGSEDRDGIVTGTRRLHEHLEQHGIAHGCLVYAGGHRWIDWRPIFPAVLRFLVDRDAFVADLHVAPRTGS